MDAIFDTWFLQVNLVHLCKVPKNKTNVVGIANHHPGNSQQITDTGVMALARLGHLESLSLTSFEAITDTSIGRLVPELVNLRQLCLRDNAQLTIRTLDACVEAAAANPNRQLNVHMDEKQMSASQLLVKYATDYLRHTWQRRVDPLIEPCLGGSAQEGEKQLDEDQVRRHQQQQQQQQTYRRWPPNLNVVIDENLR